ACREGWGSGRGLERLAPTSRREIDPTRGRPTTRCRRPRWHHGVVQASAGFRVVRVLAPNPGPFTLEGTNTWVVGSGECMVVDPGPEDPAHREAILRAAGVVAAIVLTHRHADHAAGVAVLSRSAGAPIYAAAPGEGER